MVSNDLERDWWLVLNRIEICNSHTVWTES